MFTSWGTWGWNPTSVNTAVRPSVIPATSGCISRFTQVNTGIMAIWIEMLSFDFSYTCHMNFPFFSCVSPTIHLKNLIWQDYICTKAVFVNNFIFWNFSFYPYAQARRTIDAQFVRSHSHRNHMWRLICSSTLVRKNSNVTSVTGHSSGNMTWNSTCTLTHSM